MTFLSFENCEIGSCCWLCGVVWCDGATSRDTNYFKTTCLDGLSIICHNYFARHHAPIINRPQHPKMPTNVQCGCAYSRFCWQPSLQNRQQPLWSTDRPTSVAHAPAVRHTTPAATRNAGVVRRGHTPRRRACFGEDANNILPRD